jgi:hypothetical protein
MIPSTRNVIPCKTMRYDEIGYARSLNHTRRTRRQHRLVIRLQQAKSDAAACTTQSILLMSTSTTAPCKHQCGTACVAQPRHKPELTCAANLGAELRIVPCRVHTITRTDTHPRERPRGEGSAPPLCHAHTSAACHLRASLQSRQILYSSVPTTKRTNVRPASKYSIYHTPE